MKDTIRFIIIIFTIIIISLCYLSENISYIVNLNTTPCIRAYPITQATPITQAIPIDNLNINDDIIASIL